MKAMTTRGGAQEAAAARLHCWLVLALVWLAGAASAGDKTPLVATRFYSDTDGDGVLDGEVYLTRSANQMSLVASSGVDIPTGPLTVPTLTLSTGLGLPAGSAGTPSLYFTGDTNTGLYWVGADSIGVTAGGSLRATFGTGSLALTTPLSITGAFTGATTATFATSIAIAGGTALTTTNQTGTGSLVLATSPTLTTPVLGVAGGTSLSLSAEAVMTFPDDNAVINWDSNGDAALMRYDSTTDNRFEFTAPLHVTGAIASTSSISGTSISGTAASFTADAAINLGHQNAVITFDSADDEASILYDGLTDNRFELSHPLNVTGPVTGMTNVTGTGDIVLATSPTMTTPNIGAATGTSATLTETRWLDFGAAEAGQIFDADTGFAWGYNAAGRYELNNATHGASAPPLFFAIPFQTGTTITKLRLKWTGASAGDDLTLRLAKRVDSTTATTAWTAVQSATYNGGAIAVDTLTLSSPEVMVEGTSYAVVVLVDTFASGASVWSVGVETSARKY